MNLRVIKKEIEYFVGDFIEDCELFKALNPHKDANEIDAIIDEAVDLYNDLKNKVNNPEGKKRAFYNNLIQEMGQKVDALCEKLSAAIMKEN